MDGAVGNNANPGTSAGAGNAWATVQFAANTATAGDKVWVKASATYAELVSFNTGAHTGTAASRLVFEGYTTTTGDGGRATITGSGSRASCVVFDGTMDYVTLSNFDLTSPTGQNISGTGTVDGLILDNVRMLKGSSTPSKGITGGGYARFVGASLFRCVVSGGHSGNGMEGFNGGLIEDCEILDCGGNGITGNGYTSAPAVRRCLIARSGGDDIHFPSQCGSPVIIEDNTLDGSGTGGDGIDIGGTGNGLVVIRNNLITNHATGTGLLVGALSGTTTVYCDYNFYYNNNANTSGTNTSGPHDNTTGITVSPYTNSAGSNWNLNATASGGAVVRAAASGINDGTNISYRDGGALQHQDSGGAAGPYTWLVGPNP